MTTTLFTWLVVLGGLISPGAVSVYLFMLFAQFGAAAALALPALGGATLTPVVLFAPLLFARMLLSNGWQVLWREIAYPRAGFWLVLTVLWGLASAYIMPRLFMDEVMVRVVDRSAGAEGALLVPLHPVSTNITQSAYALGAVAVFVAMRALVSSPDRVRHFRQAVMWLAGLNCVAALINLGEIYLSTPSVLQYVRTANYAIFDGGNLGGLQRISGTFSETSVFSLFTLTMFAFTFSLWSDGVKKTQSGLLALASLMLLLFSTSGTAYVGLTIYLSVLGVVWLRQRVVPNAGTLFIGLWLAAVLLLALLLLEPELGRRIGEFFDVTVFSKLESDSGAQRSAWNRQAWVDFLATYGLGIGLGSGYASSFVMVLLSNLGIPGTLFFAAFVYQVMVARPSGPLQSNATVARAAKHAVLATLIAASVSGAVFYIGMLFYAFAAVAQGYAGRQTQSGDAPALPARRSPSLWRRAIETPAYPHGVGPGASAQHHGRGSC